MVMRIWAMAPDTIVYLWAASTVKAVTPSARLPSAVSLRSVRCPLEGRPAINHGIGANHGA